MNTSFGHTCRTWIACMALLLTATAISAADETWLERKIKMKTVTDTRYQLLRGISEQTGYLFIYDSQVLNNDEIITLRKGEYTLRTLIHSITGNDRICIELIGKHIALSLPPQEKKAAPKEDGKTEAPFITLYGMAYDKYSHEAISSASVSLAGSSTGTITNQNGAFRITLPDSLRHAAIKVSHVGYESIVLPVDSALYTPLNLYLEPKVIPLQEVMIRPVNPVSELREMLKARAKNYAATPVNLTAFYREGVDHKQRNLDFTEAILKIHKTGFQDNLPDQAKLIKMRRVIDRQERDTIFTKIKSGINTVLLLDLIKNVPEFFEVDDPVNPYTYLHSDINVIDNRLVNVISFEQNEFNKEPLHKGELFIDMDNYALIEARFEINPQYAAKATRLFVEKQSKLYKLTLKRAGYSVSYKSMGDGKYYINHVRGELEFKAKRKRQLFSSALKIWFEMVNCKVDTANVESIPRSERISPRSIFAETNHDYDPNFWEHFNVILPEEKLRELIIKNLAAE